jgi:hypothetical protein
MKDSAYAFLDQAKKEGIPKVGEDSFKNVARLLDEHGVSPAPLYSILSHQIKDPADPTGVKKIDLPAKDKAAVIDAVYGLANTMAARRGEDVKLNLKGPDIMLAAANLMYSGNADKDDLVKIFRADPKNGGENILRLQTAMTLKEEDGTVTVLLPTLKDAAVRISEVSPKTLTKLLGAIDILRGDGAESGDMRAALAPVIGKLGKNSTPAQIDGVMRTLNAAAAAVGNNNNDRAIEILKAAAR